MDRRHAQLQRDKTLLESSLGETLKKLNAAIDENASLAAQLAEAVKERDEILLLATKGPLTKDEYQRWQEIVDPEFAAEMKAMAELKRQQSAALKVAKEGA